MCTIPLISKVLYSTEKSYTYLFNPVFFLLSAVKYFELLPKHNRYGFISESAAFN